MVEMGDEAESRFTPDVGDGVDQVIELRGRHGEEQEQRLRPRPASNTARRWWCRIAAMEESISHPTVRPTFRVA
jgi:hypothetical protein